MNRLCICALTSLLTWVSAASVAAQPHVDVSFDGVAGPVVITTAGDEEPEFYQPGVIAEDVPGLVGVWSPSDSINHDSAACVGFEPDTKLWRGAGNAFRHDFTFGGVPMMVAGLAIWGAQDHYRSLTHNFFPHFNSLLDNYSQYSPLVATAVLKACGVKTRSSWGRFAVSSAFSGVLMTGIVNSIKSTSCEMRPDGTTRNSFPSGHTATAFMCAQIMAKELGWRSPWYTIGGYTVAATTGIVRIFNNRHWINDVVFGAGVGITSVDLGYFLTDLIFKDKGLDPQAWNDEMLSGTNDSNPSFFAISMAVGTGTDLRAPEIYDAYDRPDGRRIADNGATPMDLRLDMGATTSVSLEGAWFWNRYFGVGVRARAIAAPITTRYNPDFQPYTMHVDGLEQSPYRLAGLESSALAMLTFDAGLYASLPVGKRWRIGANVMLGDRLTPDFSLKAYSELKPEYRRKFEYMHEIGQMSTDVFEQLTQRLDDSEFIKIESSNALNFSTGLSLTYAMRPGANVRLFVDYAHSAPCYTYHVFSRFRPNFLHSDGESVLIDDVTQRRTHFNEFTFGMTVAVALQK